MTATFTPDAAAGIAPNALSDSRVRTGVIAASTPPIAIAQSPAGLQGP